MPTWTKEQLANHPRLGQLIGVVPAKQKASDDELRKAYLETGSVWKTAERFGMCGQSVHERVSAMGIVQSDAYTPEVQEKISKFYAGDFKKGDLEIFCKANGLLKPNVSRWARERGLTRASRKISKSVCAEMSIRQKALLEKIGHPKGMLGKKHTQENLDRLRETSTATWNNMDESARAARNLKIVKTAAANGTLYRERSNASWKAAWRVIGGVKKYFRSRWEANYARYLELQKQHGLILAWQHEPETFWFDGVKRGCVSYLPDFKVTLTSGAIEYHEVKGWMDDRSKTKIKRMAKYHPNVKLIIRDSAWFKANRNLSGIIHEWEK